MCIECWWDCLDVAQKFGLGVIGILWLLVGLIFLGWWMDGSTMRPSRWEWLFAGPAIIVVGGIVIAIVASILYGLYGAVSCLF